MATFPTNEMRDAATKVIELLGDDFIFERRNAENIWEAQPVAARVHIQPRSSCIRQVFSGIEGSDDFRCFAPHSANVQKGDRTLFGNVYYLVDYLSDLGTHLEFGIKETKETR